MDKDVTYFPHFHNARHDRKLKRLRLKHGWSGYGIYFALLEILRAETDLKFPMADIEILCDELNVSEDVIRSIIKDFDLFKSDKNHFHSPKLVEYLKPYFVMREQRRMAGKASAKSRQQSTTDQRSLNGRSTGAQRMFEQNKKERKKEVSNDLSLSFFSAFPEVKPDELCNTVSPQTRKAMILHLCRQLGLDKPEARWYWIKITNKNWYTHEDWPMKFKDLVSDIQTHHDNGWMEQADESQKPEGYL